MLRIKPISTKKKASEFPLHPTKDPCNHSQLQQVEVVMKKLRMMTSMIQLLWEEGKTNRNKI